MARKRKSTSGAIDSSRVPKQISNLEGIPTVYAELFAVDQDEPVPPQRPFKRPLTGRRVKESLPPPPPPPVVQTVLGESSDDDHADEEDEDVADVEFEDVIPVPPPLASTDEITPETDPRPRPTLELNLSAQYQATNCGQGANRKPRRRALSRQEWAARLNVHKVHLLCLLAHCARRNYWCNDEQVQEALAPILSDQIRAFLNPPDTLSQFGRTESLKRGLQQASAAFKIRFKVTERGMRRALWAEEHEQLAEFEMPDDAESCLDRHDIRRAAKTMRGSRDVGAQLFCAMLRHAGVQTRLVCSLQPLSAVAGAPTLPPPKDWSVARKPGEGNSRSTRSRQPRQPRKEGHKNERLPSKIHESPFPVYWAEILDVAHQKWQPIDAMVTGTLWKPRLLEPPGSDKENCLSYVVAFDTDGTCKDVTRRYARAYMAKTRRTRVECADLEQGARWWRLATRYYRQRREARLDLDEIEDNELAAVVAREPMPRNIADFRDHPLYALERHLRRHEVLVPGSRQVGTVGAGPSVGLERIYRRSDVRAVRSQERWFRIGREVKPGQQPVKVLMSVQRNQAGAQAGDRSENAKGKGSRKKNEGADADTEDDANEEEARSAVGGKALFMMEQTILYRAPRVEGGRVPKNRFGNVELFVASMIPEGGTHVRGVRAARAAMTLGVDYTPAVTGFEFGGAGRRRGDGRRVGTAVLDGIVVASEHEAAVRAVVDGLADVEVEEEAERRAVVARRMWKRFAVALRIRMRVFTGHEDEALGLIEPSTRDDGESESESGSQWKRQRDSTGGPKVDEPRRQDKSWHDGTGLTDDQQHRENALTEEQLENRGFEQSGGFVLD